MMRVCLFTFFFNSYQRMWKLQTTERSLTLSPHIVPGNDSILAVTDIPNIREHVRNNKTQDRTVALRKPPKASKAPRKKKEISVIADLANAIPEEWTEAAVYAYLSETPKWVPVLQRVDEMLIRTRGGHKFLCCFLNVDRVECRVWVADVLVYRFYPQSYVMAKKQFVALASR